MALNIPMPESSGNSLLKGLDTGSNLMRNMILNKYNNTIHPSGDVANAAYVEQLRNKFGENDPRYVEAKRAHDLSLQGRQSLIGYRDVLNQTAGIRAASPLGKLIAEGKGQGAMDILQNGNNFAPVNARYKVNQQYYNQEGEPVGVDNNQRTSEEREAYERTINKQTSDTQARNILLRAENLDITRNSINPDDLTRYSGLKGTGKYLYEAAQATKGNPSEEFLANQNSVAAASLMADQMRQFYGDSIQPSAMERLRQLSNPSAWYKDPKVAKSQWEQLNKILDSETETYRKNGTSPIKLKGIDFNGDKFVLGKNNQEKNNVSTEKKSVNSNEGGSYNMNDAVKQLLKIDPRYTEENIRTTVEETGKSVDEVIYELFQRSAKRRQ